MDILSMFSAALMCVSLNVYHEARNEPIQGQYAVAFVTMNRAKEYRQGVCEVVYKKRQFSWTNDAFNKDGSMKKSYLPRTGKKWDQARKIALEVMRGSKKDFTNRATYFYADYIKAPRWSASKEVVGKWGVHIFLREHRTSHYRKQIPITVAAASVSHRNRLERVSSVMPMAYSGQDLKQIQFQCRQSVHQSVGQTMLVCSQQNRASYSPSGQQQSVGLMTALGYPYSQDQCLPEARHPVPISLLEDYSLHHHLLI